MCFGLHSPAHLTTVGVVKQIHIPSLAWEEIHSPLRRFHSFVRNVSVALGGPRNLGPWGGGHPFDVQIRRIPAGASICPYHLHFAQWELFVVQRGTATVRTTDGTFTVPTGEVFVHPPGTPHQLTNRDAEDLEVLIVADNPPLDGCYYPDSDKWALRPPGKFFRMTEAGYFDGEEPSIPNAPPYQPSPSPPSLPVLPFAQRRVSLATLPWEEFASPKRKFRGFSKELSIALGAKRNTPSGLGGHPFDLELQKLLPGECGCPFHSHAAEWEMFLILKGTATVRAKADARTLHAGDVVLHPPGEAHQITNASTTDDLEFFVIADNAPVEFCHYPDSGKWGFRNPRKIFRPADTDYWDGEE
jgi:uncharacterized cupin superfamily protein